MKDKLVKIITSMGFSLSDGGKSMEIYWRNRTMVNIFPNAFSWNSDTIRLHLWFKDIDNLRLVDGVLYVDMMGMTSFLCME